MHFYYISINILKVIHEEKVSESPRPKELKEFETQCVDMILSMTSCFADGEEDVNNISYNTNYCITDILCCSVNIINEMGLC